MLRQFSVKRIVGSFALDWLGTLAALLLAVYLRVALDHLPAAFPNLVDRLREIGWRGDWPFHLLLPQVFVLVGLIWPFFFITFSVYDGRRNANLKTELLNVFLATITSTLVLAGVLFLTYRETSRGLFLLFFLLDLGLLLGGRALWYGYRSARGQWRYDHNHPVLIVGAGLVGQNVAVELQKYGERDIMLVGFVDDDPDKQDKKFAGLPVLGTLDRALDIVRDYQIRDAVIALPLRAHDRLLKVARTLQRAMVRVHVIPDLFALSFTDAALDGFGGIPVIDLGQSGIHGSQRAVKRVFDVVAVAFGLLLLTPFLLMIAVLIKLDSSGPVFYRQKRVGENGQFFTMLKFRSMKDNSDPGIHQRHVVKLIKENMSPEQIESNSGKSLKLEKDPRITRMGHILRKTSLDELPQLINVLRGEMSLVGPRPPLPYEVEVYQEWHKRRLKAPPGITGLWQVRARNQVSFDEMVRLDLEYIENQSLWLDIKLILQTPWALIKAKGAG